MASIQFCFRCDKECAELKGTAAAHCPCGHDKAQHSAPRASKAKPAAPAAAPLLPFQAVALKSSGGGGGSSAAAAAKPAPTPTPAANVVLKATPSTPSKPQPPAPAPPLPSKSASAAKPAAANGSAGAAPTAAKPSTAAASTAGGVGVSSAGAALTAQFGSLLHCGVLKKKSRSNRHSWHSRLVALFERALLYYELPKGEAGQAVEAAMAALATSAEGGSGGGVGDGSDKAHLLQACSLAASSGAARGILPLGAILDAEVAREGKGSDARARFNVHLADKRVYEFIAPETHSASSSATTAATAGAAGAGATTAAGSAARWVDAIVRQAALAARPAATIAPASTSTSTSSTASPSPSPAAANSPSPAAPATQASPAA